MRAHILQMRNLAICLAACYLLVGFVGCGDDDPTSSSGSTGTVKVNQVPNVLDGAGWSLSGAQPETGVGDVVLAEMPIGEYTVTWESVSGHITPPNNTQALSGDETITFVGTYTENISPTGEFVQIPSGTFAMGSPQSEIGRASGETQHLVTLTTSFEIQETEVTNQQYADLAQWAHDHGYCTVYGPWNALLDAMDSAERELLHMNSESCKISFNEGSFSVDSGHGDHPVTDVSWYGAAVYCEWLNLQAGLPLAYNHDTGPWHGNDLYNAQGYRLPHEAEWEYACRAGSGTALPNGDLTDTGCNDPLLGLIGWYCGNTNLQIRSVGQLISNDWGLYDMHGNVQEWCTDYCGGGHVHVTDPAGSGWSRARRGGFYGIEAWECRSACRSNSTHFLEYSSHVTGFRPVRSIN